MPSIDDRVVQMSFDNKAFEKKVSQTIASLDKLQKSLASSEATQGLTNISKGIKGLSFNNLSASVDGVSKKFLALGTIGFTVLNNLTNRAVNAGIRLVKSLSLDQVTAGFREYETNMKSIQTILANTKADGTNLGQVNDALDELNSYADLTIYNFAQMARNIGTFTAAGVDLDTSVDSIKGIANAAAISGSTSQQASTAMYQLSQAIASGSLKLMDWNSVVNAGMGGEVMQKALFDTGKAMKTLTGVELDTTFDQWKDAGNTFRASLQDGWVTTEVLTTALKGFSGEMTEAELKAVGFSDIMVAEFIELGETGVEAATKVRTLTQLIDTAQEAVGSGWSSTFRIVIGDFEEATELFTVLSDAFGDFAAKNADARNDLLQTWKDFGGRRVLIESFANAFKALGDILTPIRNAFRNIFPQTTALNLLQATVAFRKFTEAMAPSRTTVQNVQRIFRGFFAVLEIGWTVVKEGVGFIKDLFTEFSGAGSGGFLQFFADIGDALFNLNKKLVDGEGIASFFDLLADVVRNPVKYLNQLLDVLKDLANVSLDKIKSFFTSLREDGTVPQGAIDAFDRLGQGAGRLKSLGEGLFEVFQKIGDVLSRVGEALEPIYIAIRDWFKDLGGKLADAIEPGDYDKTMDAVNAGLLGGIALLLKSFIDNGFGSGFFGKDMFEGITDSLEEVTGVLQAMQADLRANALLKIAGAIGILAVSMLLLATINSEDMTRSLTAMSAGFAQLVLTFGAINKLAVGPSSAVQFSVIATGMVLISGAILLLSVAVKNLAGLDWEELSKGLIGVAALLGALIATTHLMGDASGMIRAGIGMSFMAIGLNLLYFAVKNFSTLSWEEMAKGLAGVAGGLTVMIAAMHLMPEEQMLRNSLALVAIAGAMNLLYFAVKNFSSLSWEEMGKGLAGVAGALVGIAIAMGLMPMNVSGIGIQLLLMSGALYVIAEVMKSLADLSWEEIGKGLTVIAGALLAMSLAAYYMSASVSGAIATVIMAGALYLMADVMKKMGNLKWQEIVTGLLAIAGIFAVFAAAAALLNPVIPAMLGLGIAMLALGAGVALVGIGLNALARAFRIVAKAGDAGVKVMFSIFDQFITRIPKLAKALALGFLDFATTFIEAAPVLVKAIGVLIGHILETIIELTPQIVETLIVMTTGLIDYLRETVPLWIDVAFELLLAFLSGFADNIAPITSEVVDIITGFIDGLTDRTESIVESVYNFVKAVIVAVVKKLPDLAGDTAEIGLLIIDGMLEGLISGLTKMKDWFVDMFNSVVGWIKDLFGISSPATEMIPLGKDILQGLLDGIIEIGEKLFTWFYDLHAKVIGYFVDAISWLYNIGKDIIQGLFDGIEEIAKRVWTFYSGIASKIKGYFLDAIGWLWSAGKDVFQGLWDGHVLVAEQIWTWISEIKGIILGYFRDTIGWLWSAGRDLLEGLKQGMEAAWGGVKSWAIDKADSLVKIFTGRWDEKSPSKVMDRVGVYFMEGLAMGLASGADKVDRAASGVADSVLEAYQLDGEKIKDHTQSTLQKAIADAVEAIQMSDLGNPVITPVLDLSQVNRDAKSLTSLFDQTQLQGNLSYALGSSIASTEVDADTVSEQSPVTQEIKFEQYNYSPEALSEADIYRRTNSQLALAKEELSIKS